MSNMKFELPGVITDPSKDFNQALLTGVIVKATNYKTKEKIEFADEYEKKDGGTYYQFNAELKVGNNNVRLKAMNNKVNLTRVNDFANMVDEGQYVDISGQFRENYDANKNRFYREVQVTKITDATPEKIAERANVILQGKVLNVETSDKLRLVLGLKQWNDNTKYDQFCIVGYLDNCYSEWASGKVKVGDTIKVACRMVNKLEKDEFGLTTSAVNETQLAKVIAFCPALNKPKF